ncbi:hypothetical protein LCGC14_0369830 [marine sediment metagenome]|uniref:Phage ABA sandwich domain-containing protein n=1 Tax=marine sediment metagenome TaxID=412755 RepID=A0A0F9TBC5_9ZZZZ
MKEILEMTGTPDEVDWLAKEVMGWVLMPSKWKVSIWNPFKSWNDAEMVVERMKEKKWEIDLLSINGSDEYVCYFKRMSGKKPWRTVKASAADVPTAISRAALLTLEGT